MGAAGHQNRLVTLTKTTSGGPGAYSYVYDYRTRRVIRSEPNGLTSTVTKVVFAGGTSCQELTVGGSSTPVVEYVRGSDYGGGVGGILYTIRGSTPSYNHYNNRGDVVAKTAANGSLTYEAAYEAYGKRTAEQGATDDRQKANTKDEDPTGLLNEGFRYRDLETGTFITRDPLGFVDGPNMYAYVVQNPWTMFDPEGLSADDLIGQGGSDAESVLRGNVSSSGGGAGPSMRPPQRQLTDKQFNAHMRQARVKGEYENLRSQKYPDESEHPGDRGMWKQAQKKVDEQIASETKALQRKAQETPGGQTAKQTSTSDKQVPNKDGSKGNTEHQEGVERLLKTMQNKYPAATQFLENKSIEQFTGVKRRPDVTAMEGDKVLGVGEVPRTNKNGTFVSREQKKVVEYSKAGLDLTTENLPPPKKDKK